MCRHRCIDVPPPKVVYNWEVENRLLLEIAKEQYSIIAPSEGDLATGRLMRDVAGGDGTLKMAARKLNTVGEVSSQSAWLNEPGRLEKIESTLALAKSMDNMKKLRMTTKLEAAEDKVRCFRSRAPAALEKLRCGEFNLEAVKKLTLADLKGLMLTELSVGASEVPTGKKDKIVAVFMDLAARRQWTPSSISLTDGSGTSTTNGSSSISVVAPRVQKDDPLKGRKVRKVFVDEDTGEEEYYDGKIDAIFVDGGVAHYHIVYDDGDEEEVYRDEAIALLLAANGFD